MPARARRLLAPKKSLAELDPLATDLTPALREQLGVEFVTPRSCRDAKQELCLWVRLPLCAQPLERVAQVFAERPKARPDARVSLLVEYTGTTPRWVVIPWTTPTSRSARAPALTTESALPTRRAPPA